MRGTLCAAQQVGSLVQRRTAAATFSRARDGRRAPGVCVTCLFGSFWLSSFSALRGPFGASSWPLRPWLSLACLSLDREFERVTLLECMQVAVERHDGEV